MDDDDRHCCSSFLDNGCSFLIALVTIVVMFAAFGVTLPVRITVTDASLSRLDLNVVTNNCTGTAGAADASSVSVAYNLSLTVQLRNCNWATWVELTAPLDAELRFAGRRFDGARLADAGSRSVVRPRRTEEFRVLAASPSSSSPGGVALKGSAGAAAELARERAEGVFEMELRIAGELAYRPGIDSKSRLEATCPLKMLMPNAPPGAHLVVPQKGVSCDLTLITI